MLDLNEVAMFIQVVRLGSFAKAARHLRMPSATVSRRIQQLETRLGTRLMQRSTRKLTLTSAGRSFHERCEPAVEKLIEAGQSHVAGAQEASGAIRVAAPASFFEYFDMQWVSTFLAAHPLVQIDFVLNDLPADLIAGRIDVAFHIGALGDSSYVARRIFTCYGGLLASPAYLAANGTPGDLRELAEHECVTQPPETGSFAVWRLQGPDGAEEEVRVRGRFTSNVHVALREAACAGLGIVALPTVLTAAEVATGRLVPVLPGYMRACRGMSVVYPSRQQRPLAVTAFVDMAVEKLGAQAWAPSSASQSGDRAGAALHTACAPDRSR